MESLCIFWHGTVMNCEVSEFDIDGAAPWIRYIVVFQTWAPPCSSQKNRE